MNIRKNKMNIKLNDKWDKNKNQIHKMSRLNWNRVKSDAPNWIKHVNIFSTIGQEMLKN